MELAASTPHRPDDGRPPGRTGSWTPTIGHRRRSRPPEDAIGDGDLLLAPPPELGRGVPQSLPARLLPAVMVVAVIGMIAMMVVTGGRTAFANPLFFMFPLMMLMSMAGMVAAGGRGGPPRAAEVNETRKDYLRHLAQLRDRARSTAAAQRARAVRSHPHPTALVGLIGTDRMWERRPTDVDFGELRVGLGTHRLASAMVPPETAPVDELEPVGAVALRRFVQAHSGVPDLPTAVALRGFPAIGVSGPRDAVDGLVRAMVTAAAAHHGPDHLWIAVIVADPAAPAWDWVKWLPHAEHPARRDGLGPARMVYRSLADCEHDLADDLADRGRFARTEASTGLRHLLVVLADGAVTGDEELASGAGLDGVTVLDLGPDDDSLAARRGLGLVVDGTALAAVTEAGVEEFAVADTVPLAYAETFARTIARYRPATTDPLVDLDAPTSAADPGLPALLGAATVDDHDPAVAWRGRAGRDRLRVPIGYTADGAAVELDLKESAHGGMGPHGLCVGATGSGKSELLRTLVLGLIATHSPDELNLVLVDFKGGATFLGLDRANHVAAVITNLEQELTMVDRMADALSGELQRRQELLRAAGSFANVTDYERARRSGADLAPLPALVIVVDEFSELLAQKPDFAELFVAIGRLGRSLHIHLLLASQRLEEGRLRGLDSHLSYRIGLKTFSANESRTVLGVPDAYHLPSEPGAAYLKCDADPPVRFRTSYVSGPYVAAVADRGPVAATGGIVVFTAATVVEPPREPEPPSDDTAAPTVLDTLIGRVEGHGSPPHQVWLPPLESAVGLDAVPGGLDVPHTVLTVAVGVVDRPRDQRRDPLTVDLSGAAGHVAIVGGPQSGKSTALRTLLCAAALTHTPREMQFYCLDFGGGGLSAVAGLPHVGGVASRSRPDAVARTVAEVTAVLRSRETRFADTGVDSMRDYRTARAAGADPDPFGDVFLVIDGIGVLRSEFEDLEEKVADLVAQGLSYGVHVIVTAGRWPEIRPGVKDLLGTRIELRLGDPLDSEMGRRAAATVPTGRPGRGITADGLHLLVAAPRADGDADPATLGEGTARLVETIAAAYPDQSAPPVRTLAATVDPALLADLVAAGTDPPVPAAGRAVIGIGDADLAPFVVDFAREPHLLVFGDAECGKTGLLRVLLDQLLVDPPGDGGAPRAKAVLLDYRRTLLGAVTGDALAGYATSARTATPMMAQLAEFLAARLPADDATADELAARTPDGPDVYLVIDDYDLVSTASGNPLLPLVDLLGHARDVGLRVIVARRSGGAGRALFDPFLARLRDLSCDVLLMSGDPDEGYLVGRERLRRLPVGRGRYMSRTRPAQTVQIVSGPAVPAGSAAEPSDAGSRS